MDGSHQGARNAGDVVMGKSILAAATALALAAAPALVVALMLGMVVVA